MIKKHKWVFHHKIQSDLLKDFNKWRCTHCEMMIITHPHDNHPSPSINGCCDIEVIRKVLDD